MSQVEIAQRELTIKDNNRWIDFKTRKYAIQENYLEIKRKMYGILLWIKIIQ